MIFAKITPRTKASQKLLKCGVIYAVEIGAYDDFGKPEAVKGAGAGKVIGVG